MEFEIVINQCHGGFSASDALCERLIELGVPVFNDCPENSNKLPAYITKQKTETAFGCFYYLSKIERNDPRLVQAVKELGDKASNEVSKLKVVKIKLDHYNLIDEYDGFESIRNPVLVSTEE